MVRNYTTRNSTNGTTSKQAGATTMHDTTVNHPPVILFGLGGFGFLAGVLANLWQVGTTFLALWTITNKGNGPTGNTFWQRQPIISAICLLIATCAQYFLQLLVFRIDTSWKKQREEGKSSGGAMFGSVVHIVQQTDIITILSILAFIVDTVGDFTFISLYTASIFIIFAYAVALYAFSTLGFVRGIEYLWAGWAAVYSSKGK
jgi:hypothetical protein